MTIYNIVTAICLIAIVGITIGTFGKIFVADRAERLRALKNFKRGRFALIYLAAIPLYWMAHCYNGTPIGGSLLLAIKSCVDLVVLKYDYTSAAKLMTDSVFFRVVIDFAFVLVAINAVMFAFALIGLRIVNRLRIAAALRKHTVHIVVGYNEQNLSILRSADPAREGIILVAPVGVSAQDTMYVERRGYVTIAKDKSLSEYLSAHIGHLDKKRVNVILNTGDDKTNTIYASQLSEWILRDNLAEFAPNERIGLYVYVFGEPEKTSVFRHFTEKTNGCVQYVNKYRMVAMDFVERFPLTQFMTERQLDTQHALLRDDVDVNVMLIGFGKTGQQLFLTSVANNQFLRRQGQGVTSVPVHYRIFDKKDSQNDRNLNHNYFRYTKECDAIRHPEAYLPLPEPVADEKFYKMSTEDTEFYDTLRAEMQAADGRSAYNYIVIAAGTDLQNIDLADKIYAKIREWNMEQDTHMFVKVRDGAFAESVVHPELRFMQGIQTFGREDQIVFRIDRIVNERMEAMAKLRHLTYFAAYVPDRSEQEIRAMAWQDWYQNYLQIQRESNVYACLSLRMKLQLMGYDYVPADALGKAAEAEWFERYQQGDPVVYSDTVINGKRSVVYCNAQFERDSLRKTFAIQEHQRWNACMICNGIVPSTLEQIRTDNRGKRLDLRRHGNLTTFEGLLQFRDIVVQNYGKDAESADVIRYDYQLMDDAAWLLNSCGYKIVARQDDPTRSM